jgi:hypothetical protein
MGLQLAKEGPANTQLAPSQQQIYLMEIKFWEDTRHENQLEAAKQQHRDLI